MRQIKETSKENYHNIKHVLPKLADRALKVAKEHPSSTVDELVKPYSAIFGYLPRNELAKSISNLLKNGKLVEAGDRTCTVSRKMKMTVKPCEGEPVPKNRSREVEIKRILKAWSLAMQTDPEPLPCGTPRLNRFLNALGLTTLDPWELLK